MSWRETDVADDYPTAYLYDSRRRPIGFAGVLVFIPFTGNHLAVFSPWPARLNGRSPFSVRFVGRDQGTVLSGWALPASVDYVRVQGADEDTNVGIVTLQELPQPAPTIPQLPEFGPQDVADGLAAGPHGPETPNLRRTLGRLGGGAFDPLEAQVPAPSLGRGRGGPIPAMTPTVVTAPFTVSTGDLSAAASSICRLFRWD